MIKSIQIRNVQSHVKTILDLHPGVNVIVGETDSGKSAILRAIRWIAKNKPSWKAVHSFWGGKTVVVITTPEGFIERSKDKEKSDLYVLHRTGKEPITFKAFGASVPEEVTEFLNLDPINLQLQLDSHFLLTSSAGEVAAHFNKMANLDDIDTSMSNVNKWIGQLKSTLHHDEEDLKEEQATLKKFAYIDKAEIMLETLEEDKKRLDGQIKAYNRFFDFICRVQEVSVEIRALQNIYLKSEPYVDAVLENFKRKNEKVQRVLLLEKLLRKIGDREDSIEYYQDTLKRKEPVNTLLGLYEERKIANQQRFLLNKAISALKTNKDTLEEAETILATKTKEFKDNFPEICPLCNSVIK